MGEAKCSDWSAVLGVCDFGQNFVGTSSAPPDNADGKTLSSAKYKEMCCVEPITCASVEITATVTTTVTAATMNDDPIALTVTGSVTLEVNNANEILNDAVTKAGFVSDMIKVVATLAGIGPAYHSFIDVTLSLARRLSDVRSLTSTALEVAYEINIPESKMSEIQGVAAKLLDAGESGWSTTMTSVMTNMDDLGVKVTGVGSPTAILDETNVTATGAQEGEAGTSSSVCAGLSLAIAILAMQISQ